MPSASLVAALAQFAAEVFWPSSPAISAAALSPVSSGAAVPSVTCSEFSQ
jgi:hypothetical protein